MKVRVNDCRWMISALGFLAANPVLAADCTEAGSRQVNPFINRNSDTRTWKKWCEECGGRFINEVGRTGCDLSTSKVQPEPPGSGIIDKASEIAAHEFRKGRVDKGLEAVGMGAAGSLLQQGVKGLPGIFLKPAQQGPGSAEVQAQQEQRRQALERQAQEAREKKEAEDRALAADKQDLADQMKPDDEGESRLQPGGQGGDEGGLGFKSDEEVQPRPKRRGVTKKVIGNPRAHTLEYRYEQAPEKRAGAAQEGQLRGAASLGTEETEPAPAENGSANAQGGAAPGQKGPPSTKHPGAQGQIHSGSRESEGKTLVTDGAKGRLTIGSEDTRKSEGGGSTSPRVDWDGAGSRNARSLYDSLSDFPEPQHVGQTVFMDGADWIAVREMNGLENTGRLIWKPHTQGVSSDPGKELSAKLREAKQILDRCGPKATRALQAAERANLKEIIKARRECPPVPDPVAVNLPKTDQEYAAEISKAFDIATATAEQLGKVNAQIADLRARLERSRAKPPAERKPQDDQGDAELEKLLQQAAQEEKLAQEKAKDEQEKIDRLTKERQEMAKKGAQTTK